MSRRIEIELTSRREDGSWTWRAAGAREPKGVVEAGLLPGDAAAGAVLRADVDTGLDGTTVLAVLAPKGTRAVPDRLELLERADPDEWVTTTLARRGGRDRGDSGDRGERGDRRPGRDRDDRNSKRRSDGAPGGARSGQDRSHRAPDDRGPRRGSGDGPTSGARSDRDGGQNRPRRERPSEPTKPRPKRLRAGRNHRRAVLDELPVEHRPVAEQVLKGGIPAVRTAVEKQNEQARAAGQPEIKPEQLIDLAEQLLPRLRTAEWRDRADAALAELDELDLRDLRSVIVAAETAARDEESRSIANSLREGLARRVELEQATWLAEIASTLAEGRIVRALSLSSRPPKAGAPLPADLADRLAEASAAGLTSDTASARWATVIDALSYSPVHLKVTPESIPAEPDAELLTAVRAASSRVPQIAALFGIEPTAPPPERRRGHREGGRRGSRSAKPNRPKQSARSDAGRQQPPARAPEGDAAPASTDGGSPAPPAAGADTASNTTATGAAAEPSEATTTPEPPGKDAPADDTGPPDTPAEPAKAEPSQDSASPPVPAATPAADASPAVPAATPAADATASPDAPSMPASTDPPASGSAEPSQGLADAGGAPGHTSTVESTTEPGSPPS